jgi:hypothetical protein
LIGRWAVPWFDKLTTNGVSEYELGE